MDSHSMTKFLTELAGTTALVFLSFYGAYLTAALFVHSSEHGTVSAWRGLRERMSLLLPRDHVRICSSPALAVIRGTLEEENQRDLRNFLSWLNEIARIEKRLEVLRNRLRFAAVSAIVAVASGVVLTGPVLFGLPPLTDKVRNFTTLLPAVCILGFQLFFSARHASTWTEIKDEVTETEKQLKGLTLQ